MFPALVHLQRILRGDLSAAFPQFQLQLLVREVGDLVKIGEENAYPYDRSFICRREPSGSISFDDMQTVTLTKKIQDEDGTFREYCIFEPDPLVGMGERERVLVSYDVEDGWVLKYFLASKGDRRLSTVLVLQGKEKQLTDLKFRAVFTSEKQVEEELYLTYDAVARKARMEITYKGREMTLALRNIYGSVAAMFPDDDLSLASAQLLQGVQNCVEIIPARPSTMLIKGAQLEQRARELVLFAETLTLKMEPGFRYVPRMYAGSLNQPA